MAKFEFYAEVKLFGNPLVKAFDEEGTGFDRVSVIIPRKRFSDGKSPKKIKVTVEWEEE